MYDLTDNSEYSFAASVQSKPRNKLRWLWFMLPAWFAISALVAGGYFITRRDIKIIDGDRLLELRTHQKTAESVLREANVQLRPEDVVLPALTTLLQHNDLVVVKRARPVRIQIDDETPKLILTQSQSANDILNQLGIKATAFDRLLVNGQASDTLPVINAPAPATVDIVLRRSLEIDIAEKDKPLKKAKTSAQTVGEALMQNGYFIRLADRISPSPA
ncbi:MAG: ubiquitin-like domain-containing protein, partial [Chloroflexota bacterium]